VSDAALDLGPSGVNEVDALGVIWSWLPYSRSLVVAFAVLSGGMSWDVI
jgi:hypothetical protein